MDNGIINSIVTVALALTGVAIIAVLVSNNANTSGVITSGGNAFTGALKAAISPVTSGGGGGNFFNLNSGGAGYYA